MTHDTPTKEGIDAVTQNNLAGACAICRKSVSLRARHVTCFVCSTEVHLGCDKTLKPELVVAVKSDKCPGVCFVCSPCRTKVSDSQAQSDSGQSLSGSTESCLDRRMQTLELSLQRMEREIRLLSRTCVCPLDKLSTPANSTVPPNTTCEVTDSDSAVRVPNALTGPSGKPNRSHLTKNGPSNSCSPTVAQLEKQCELSQGGKSAQAGSARSADRKDINKLSVICTNVPESADTLLTTRNQHDTEEWRRLCSQMKLGFIKPLSLTRLRRSPNAPHQDQPRLLKVAVNTEKELEDILLSAYLLRDGSEKTSRVHVDEPWFDRVTAGSSTDNRKRKQSRERSMIIQNIPECPSDQSAHEKAEHDRLQ